MTRYVLLFFLLSLGTVFAAEKESPAGPAQPIESAHLHNVFRVEGQIFSGSAPDDKAGFQELAKLGVKVIVSVDGSKPNLPLAHQFGMRYVHLPIGYDGVPQARGAEFAKALQAADGPVYFHCHHGQHRGPAAVAAACISSKNWSTARAEAFLKQAGTAPEYAGLYRDVRAFRPPTMEELAKVSAKLPEQAETPPLVDTMVALDERFDALKEAQKAGWREASGHLTPAQTATLVWEQFRELLRHPSTDKHGAAYRKELEEAERTTAALRTILADASTTIFARDEALKATTQSCAACHKAHRN